MLKNFKLIGTLLSNDQHNPFGRQITIWRSTDKLKVLVKMFDHSLCGDPFNMGRKKEKFNTDGMNFGQIQDDIMKLVVSLKIIKDPKNWGSSAASTNEVVTAIHALVSEDEKANNYWVFYIAEHVLLNL